MPCHNINVANDIVFFLGEQHWLLSLKGILMFIFEGLVKNKLWYHFKWRTINYIYVSISEFLKFKKK